MDDYITVSQFVVQISSPLDNQGNSVGQFELHQLLWSLCHYLISRDTIVNGTESPSYDAWLADLIKSKPDSYFTEGYVYDLLSHNRTDLYKSTEYCHMAIAHHEFASSTLIPVSTYSESAGHKVDHHCQRLTK
jgi:hypothetical protein